MVSNGMLGNTAENLYRGRRFECNKNNFEMTNKVNLWGVSKMQNYMV